MRCSREMPNASVLPVPVRAWPIMSVPWIAIGIERVWMGNGWVMPISASASTMSGITPSSSKVTRGSASAMGSWTKFSGALLGLREPGVLENQPQSRFHGGVDAVAAPRERASQRAQSSSTAPGPQMGLESVRTVAEALPQGVGENHEVDFGGTVREVAPRPPWRRDPEPIHVQDVVW